jgi:hypothetical protein
MNGYAGGRGGDVAIKPLPSAVTAACSAIVISTTVVLDQGEMRSKMLQVGIHQEPQRGAEEQFTGAKVSNIRRVARVKTIAEAMGVHPGRSIPSSAAALMR